MGWPGLLTLHRLPLSPLSPFLCTSALAAPPLPALPGPTAPTTSLDPFAASGAQLTQVPSASVKM